MNVLNIMTPTVVTVPAQASIETAINLMLKYEISGLPVVGEHQELKGIVSESDFLRRAEIGTERRRNRWLGFLTGTGRLAEEYIHAHGRKVEDVMNRNPITVKETTSIEEVARLMEKHNIKRLPVVRGNNLVGMVTRANLIRAIVAHGSAIPSPAKSDIEIQKAILDRLGKQPWAPTPLFSIDVKDGVVTVSGVIFDPQQEEALRVLIENTPGMKRIESDLTSMNTTSALSPGAL